VLFFYFYYYTYQLSRTFLFVHYQDRTTITCLFYHCTVVRVHYKHSIRFGYSNVSGPAGTEILGDSMAISLSSILQDHVQMIHSGVRSFLTCSTVH